MPERWRLCTTRDLDPALNMGLDEVLALEAGTPEPFLRLYTWAPEALSLGYFQRLADVPAAARAPALVRRATGGGAIHHARELTYSVGAPLEHPLFRGPVSSSYERIHGLLARVLSRFGVEAHLRGEDEAISDRDGTGMCFHASTPQDLCWEGRKGVGSAQRRKGERVLHHGSIKLDTTEFEVGVARLPGASIDAIGQALVETFAESLGIEWSEAAPTRPELTRAAELGKRYADPAFVARR